MPGAGKSTFADYLASQMNIPLVSYDKILSKEWDILKSHLPDLAHQFFWFFGETVMKSKLPLIMDYCFHPQSCAQLDIFTSQYGYKTITIHFDADIDIVYKRFIERNKNANQERHIGLIEDVDYEKFSEFAKLNKYFSFGEYRIIVNTNDFSKVSYENIKNQTDMLVKELNNTAV